MTKPWPPTPLAAIAVLLVLVTGCTTGSDASTAPAKPPSTT
ncbi:MAG: hypothetical protein JWO77_2131 [Ilumatobacteraceae bacterium]|nr:hypothetical protein [Ilumatobacteraceae bacterium]